MGSATQAQLVTEDFMTGFAAFIGRIKDRPGFGSVAGFKRFLGNCDKMVALVSPNYFSRASPRLEPRTSLRRLRRSPRGLRIETRVRRPLVRVRARDILQGARGLSVAAALDPINLVGADAQPVQRPRAVGRGACCFSRLPLPRRSLLQAAASLPQRRRGSWSLCLWA